MAVGMCKHLFCVDLNRTRIDLKQVENRRFMYHPNGLLIMGAEDVVNSRGAKLVKSHAEEYHEAGESYVLPPFDDFVRGWIGVGGDYKDGIIHFAPHIPSKDIELFDKAFDFIEAALENGFDKNAVLRGFPGAWEQAIGSIISDEPSLDARLSDAQSRSGELKRTDISEELSL